MFFILFENSKATVSVIPEGSNEKTTIVVCIRGDGKIMPLFYIENERQLVSKSQATPTQVLRRAIKGMGNVQMEEWAEFIAPNIPGGSVVIMDQLRAHKFKNAVSALEARNVRVEYFPAKGSLLLSPLDRGMFGLFENMYRRIIASVEFSIPNRKIEVACHILDCVKKAQIADFFRNCCLIGEWTTRQVRINFQKEMGTAHSKDEQRDIDYYINWKIGAITISGCFSQKKRRPVFPYFLHGDALDGPYWAPKQFCI